MMSQIATHFHLKWQLIHFIFIAHLVILQFPENIGDKLANSNCPEEGIIETSEIDCELKKEIVAVHNEYRQKIAQGLVPNQPSAKNMQELFWDDELARTAQNWSHYCRFAHSDPSDRADERFSKVGENLGQTKSKRKSEKKDFKKHILKWFNENEKFNYGPVIKDNLPMSGHYSQLVSANTYLVGCGFSRFRIKNIYYRLYVCHYGPSGNIFGEPPYEAGDVNCDGDLHPSETYSNLCNRNDSPAQLDCDVSTTTTIEQPETTIMPEPITGSRRFFKILPMIHTKECNRRAAATATADKLSDEKFNNYFSIDKMFNLILWKS